MRSPFHTLASSIMIPTTSTLGPQISKCNSQSKFPAKSTGCQPPLESSPPVQWVYLKLHPVLVPDLYEGLVPRLHYVMYSIHVCRSNHSRMSKRETRIHSSGGGGGKRSPVAIFNIPTPDSLSGHVSRSVDYMIIFCGLNILAGYYHSTAHNPHTLLLILIMM